MTGEKMSLTILVAEDDLTSRNMLVAVLKKDGHTVVQANDGMQAWQVMKRSEAPPMAILDWMMPEMDGLDLVRKIRGLEYDKRPYLIMLTTKAEKSDIAACLEEGADDYLTKPFNLGELRARINVGIRMINLQHRLSERINELQNALEQIKTLRRILPICSFCKKIRDDQGYWDQVEEYLKRDSGTEVTHGVCPDCIKKYFPEFSSQKPK